MSGRVDHPAPGRVAYVTGFFAPDEAAAYLQALRDELAWKQDHVRMGAREIAMPRLVAWYGDPGAVYRYSGTVNEPLPWTERLAAIRARIEADPALRALAGGSDALRFNSVLANLYRDGHDSVAWHADDEPELGRDPVIASLSLGAVRSFELRHRRARALGLGTQRLALADGSLLILRGSTQHHWLHRVPKEPAVTAARINLTFRLIRR